jgi:hypothetical protein
MIKIDDIYPLKIKIKKYFLAYVSNHFMVLGNFLLAAKRFKVSINRIKTFFGIFLPKNNKFIQLQTILFEFLFDLNSLIIL